LESLRSRGGIQSNPDVFRSGVLNYTTQAVVDALQISRAQIFPVFAPRLFQSHLFGRQVSPVFRSAINWSVIGGSSRRLSAIQQTARLSRCEINRSETLLDGALTFLGRNSGKFVASLVKPSYFDG